MINMQTNAPKPHLIRSVVNMDMTAAEAFSEFIDNSLAPSKGGAGTVDIRITKDTITVRDDGLGMDDINRLFSLGDSSSFHDRSDIGLYGVGGSHAAIWLGSKLEVQTTHDGKTQRHRTDWDHCVEANQWPAVCEKRRKAAKKARGTLLTIRRHPFRKFQIPSLMERLSQTFAPGLESGKSILVNGEPLVAPARPALKEEKRQEGEVAEMKYSARVGIMAKGDARRYGIHVRFSHRIITTLRFEGLSELVYGEVDLSADWREALSAHKTEIVRYRDGLIGQLKVDFDEILEKAAKEKRQVEIEQLCDALAETVQARLAKDGDIDINAGSGDEEGETRGGEGGGDGTRPTRAKRSDAGQKHESHTAIDVSFGQLGDYGPFMSEFYPKSGKVEVVLNQDQPEISRLMQMPPAELLQVHVTYAVSTALSAYMEKNKKVPPLRGLPPTFDEGASVDESLPQIYKCIWAPPKRKKPGRPRKGPLAA